jgi:hypothetical protein
LSPAVAGISLACRGGDHVETDPDRGGEEVPDQGTQEPETDTPSAPERDDGGGDAGADEALGEG